MGTIKIALVLLRSVYATTYASENYLEISLNERACVECIAQPGDNCTHRDEPASKKAKKENGAAGDTTAVATQQTQSSNAQQGEHDSSNAYNYYGQQWGGHYVSVLP